MTAHELARKLLEGPNMMVTLSGYEGGAKEVSHISPPNGLTLDYHDQRSYCGPHQYIVDWYDDQLPMSHIFPYVQQDSFCYDL